MNQPEKLYQLQEIDLNMLRSRQRLQVIAAELGRNEAVQAAQAQVERAQKTLTPLQTRARDLDLEIRSNQEKARLTEENLYSGAVKNPKEMQDMQQEIESLKKRHGELETHMLETMFAVEEAESQLDEAQTQLAAVTKQLEQEHGTLIEEQAQLESRLRQLKTRREEALSGISAESLKIYDTMKPRKNNQPVALMTGNTCGLCGVAQNMMIEREVRQAQKLVYCSNCGRILVSRP